MSSSLRFLMAGMIIGGVILAIGLGLMPRAETPPATMAQAGPAHSIPWPDAERARAFARVFQ